MLAGCQSRLIYFPRPYRPGAVAEWQHRTSGKLIHYETSQGSQQAFLQGNLRAPRNLWLVCGGNATVALDWSEWLVNHAPREDAWLLIDFPGYGASEGSPTPSRVHESLTRVVPLAWEELGRSGEPDPAKLRFFGHSLGGAACLIAASEFRIQRGVLISPFTSTMDMARHLTGIPIGFLVTHRYDNSARLAEFSSGKVMILHGTEDEAIPVQMSRTLAAEHQEIVRLQEIPGARHNSIPQTHAAEIAAALREIGAAN
jgi:uncharacterized protein